MLGNTVEKFPPSFHDLALRSDKRKMGTEYWLLIVRQKVLFLCPKGNYILSILQTKITTISKLKIIFKASDSHEYVSWTKAVQQTLSSSVCLAGINPWQDISTFWKTTHCQLIAITHTLHTTAEILATMLSLEAMLRKMEHAMHCRKWPGKHATWLLRVHTKWGTVNSQFCVK